MSEVDEQRPGDVVIERTVGGGVERCAAVERLLAVPQRAWVDESVFVAVRVLRVAD